MPTAKHPNTATMKGRHGLGGVRLWGLPAESGSMRDDLGDDLAAVILDCAFAEGNRLPSMRAERLERDVTNGTELTVSASAGAARRHGPGARPPPQAMCHESFPVMICIAFRPHTMRRSGIRLPYPRGARACPLAVCCLSSAWPFLLRSVVSFRSRRRCRPASAAGPCFARIACARARPPARLSRRRAFCAPDCAARARARAQGAPVPSVSQGCSFAPARKERRSGPAYAACYLISFYHGFSRVNPVSGIISGS